MAIIIEERKRKISLVNLVVYAVIALIVFSAVYFLFFSSTPAVDVIIPAPLLKTTQIATFELDPSAVFDSREFKLLKKPMLPPGSGTFGRDNPFLSF